MPENLFSFQMIIIYALLYGITMKIADLLDEHGLKWFEGSAIIFGILYAIFGVLVMIGNNQIANILLAMVLCMILRKRLDFLNHQIAATIMIIGFLFTATFEPKLFLIFYLIFLIFGALRDYTGEKIKNKTTLSKIYDNIMWYYPIPTFVYCLFYGNWIILWAFLAYTIAYDLTKFIYKNKGYY